MTRLIFVLTSAATMMWTAAACNTMGQHHVAAINPQDTLASRSWKGALSTPPGMVGAVDIQGTVSLQPSGGSTIATITITNAPPGGVHPWQVESGQCSDSGSVIGSPDLYPVLTVADNGTASSTVTLAVAFPDTGSYHARVYAAPDNRQTVIACGNLAPPNKA